MVCITCGTGFAHQLDGAACDACEELVHLKEDCSALRLIERQGKKWAHLFCNDCSEMEN